MHNWDDDYIYAWNQGGASAANALLKRKFPTDDAQIAELRLEIPVDGISCGITHLVRLTKSMAASSVIFG